VNDHCPDCGALLAEVKAVQNFGFRVLKCPRCSGGDFIEISDTKWIFPMLRLDPGIRKLIEDAEESLLEQAAQRIRQIDYKTISIVGFEQTLLGCFDPDKAYRIIYHDGSEK
jgi:phage FluMu protein Com